MSTGEDSSPTQSARSIHHYGGGVLCLDTLQEQEAFARGRIESAADLVELCASSLRHEHASVHSVLMQVYSMLHEATEALPHHTPS